MDGNGNRPSKRTHLLLLEPIQLLGTLWLRVLGEDPDFEQVEALSDPMQALEELWRFDVVVTGPSLSQEQALAFTREAVISHPAVRVVVTGIPRTEAAVVQAAEAGAAGLVLREQPIEEALSAIRAARNGEAHIAPGVAPMLMRRLVELTSSISDADTVGRRYLELTPREREVLDLIALGLTNQQIAERLVLAVGTVKNHVHRILDKLDKRSREEAAGYLRSLPAGFT